MVVKTCGTAAKSNHVTWEWLSHESVRGDQVTLETGEVGRQAGGAVFIRDGDTVRLACAMPKIAD